RGAPELDLLRNTISAMTPAEAAAALRPLIASPNSAHRAEALELAVVSLGPEAEPLIAETLVDADHQIAALSWRLLAAIEPLSGRTANWRDAPDEVADSILLAVALTNPEEAQRLFESIRADPQAAARFRPILDWLDAVATRIDRASLPPPAPDAHERAHTLYGHARSARALLESESP
ncbi:MAG: hypothetical protein VYC34_09810, partial [Planctomycetota bacterium]|nr:hypothetical protein [Planctomycetota bacterium]